MVLSDRITFEEGPNYSWSLISVELIVWELKIVYG